MAMMVEKGSRGLRDFGRSKLLCDFSLGGDAGFLCILLTPLLLIFYVWKIKATKEISLQSFQQEHLLCSQGFGTSSSVSIFYLFFHVVQLRHSVTWPSVIFFCISLLVTSRCWVMNFHLRSSVPVSLMASFSLPAQGKSDFPQGK